MEVYILDELLRRGTLVDRFESCIWTERYSAFGDFQLVIHSTPRSRSQFTEGVQLAINNSKRVMTIENVENRDDSEGRQLLTVTGRSLEAILEDRTSRQVLAGSQNVPSFVLNPNPPADALRDLVSYICVRGLLDTKDVIPMLVWGSSLYPTNTIAEPDQVVMLDIPPKSLYEALKEICDIYGLGFRLYRGPDTSKLYFNIYTGDDRTSSQTTKSAVIFAPDLENLSNTSEFRSIERFKNIALVIGKTRSRWVYADDAAVLALGNQRRILTFPVTDIELDSYPISDAQVKLIDAAIAASPNATHDALFPRLLTNGDMSVNEINALKTYTTSGSLTDQQKTDLAALIKQYQDYRATLPALEDALEKRGQDELTKHKPLKAMDGELTASSKYRYGVDYELGDLVEMRNDDGLTNRMRVTEQIFVDDSQGERSYPTLALDEFITPGTWYAWDANGVWDTATGTWSEQVQ